MNLKNLYQLDDLIKNRQSIRKIFFFRICGTGMGAAACLLKEKGFVVEGADHNFYPPMSTYLQSVGIPCKKLDQINHENLKEFDLVIVGNVVARNSEHAIMLEESGVPFTSFPNVLGAYVLGDLKVLGIAGTHGKTTTTYIIAQMFETMGVDIGYLIGGVLPSGPPARLGSSKYFVIESDEYDSAYFQKQSKFHSYCLDNLILTSLEYDHADIFENLEAIEDEFRRLIPTINGTVILSQDYSSCCKLQKEFIKTLPETTWIHYGESSENGPLDIESMPDGTKFKLKLDNKLESFKTNLIGTHNILNLVSGIVFAFNQGFDLDKIKNALLNLELVKRRQEVRGYFRKSLVIDDFAHHPRAVEATIQSVRARYSGRKILFIFEAVSSTARSSIYQQEFIAALSNADGGIIITPERPTTAKNADDIDCALMAKSTEESHNLTVTVVENIEKLRNGLDNLNRQNVPENLVFLFMGNGTFRRIWESDFADEINL